MVLIGNDQEGPHSSLFGIDRNTGKKVWECERAVGKQGGMSASTPVVFRGSDGTESAVFCSRYSGIAGIDPKNGKVVWQKKDAFEYRTVGSPIVFGDKVLGFSGEGARGHEFLVVTPSGEKATVAYQLRDSTPYVPTPLVIGGRLFTLSDVGVATWYVASSGKKIWQQKIGPAYFSSPVCASGKIYCISKKGDVTCLAAADDFKSLGTSRLGELTHATPAIVGGKLIVRTFTHLISVGK
jgi:outer membrane protein assembly factor BamB